MKTMRKLLALVLALTMVLSLSAVVFAADAPVISVPDSDTHSYDVYQIFTGDFSAGILSNVKWGANGTGTVGEAVSNDILSALAAIESTASNTTKLAEIEKYVDLTGSKVATISYGSSYNAVPGYYLIKDTSTFDASEDEAFTKYIVQVVDDVEVNRKAGVPETTKKIVEGEDRVDVNEAGIGDTITYEITGTIPAEAADYDYYYFIINDTMSDGLDFEEIVSVKCGEDDVAYTAKTGDDAAPYTFQIALVDAKALAGKSVVVTCTATLNSDAVATNPETNTENATYSNNPNFKYDGSSVPGDDGETPSGFPDSTKTVPTGETPDQVVKTYTTKLIVKKTDEKGKILTGAEFSLEGETNEVKVVTASKFEPAADGTYYKLTNGKYTTEAPTAEAMVAAAEGATKGYVVAEEGYDKDDAITVNSITYRPYVKETDEGKAILVHVEDNSSEYANDGNMYKKIETVTVLENGEESVNIKAFVADDGTVSFEGLGAGEYTLTETTTPAGYNTIAPIDFEITFDPDEETFDGTNGISLNSDNVLETTIVNEKGTELPETGGIGTTIFYVMGSILVLGAVVLMATKKRMSVNG